MKSPLT